MKPTSILVITYWSFEDALIQTYTLPYLKIIHQVLPPESKIYLVTLEKSGLKVDKQRAKEVTESLSKDGIEWLPKTYHPFGVSAIINWLADLINLFFLIRKNKIDFIHCWCTPAGAIGFVLSVLTNKRLVIDSYEPHAEAMVENGTWHRNSFAFKLLFRLEKWQSKRAYAVISATAGMRQYAKTKYNATFSSFFVKPACVNLELFSDSNLKKQNLVTELGFQDKIVCVYAGKFGGIYLDQQVFDFFKVAHSIWQDRFRVLLLSSHSQEEVNEFCYQSGLNPSLVTLRFVQHTQIANYMGLGDFAITPVKPVPTKRYCTPIKDGEYWALGLPVIIPQNISDDSQIIAEQNIGFVLSSLNTDNYQLAVQYIEGFLKQNRMEYFTTIRSVAKKYRSFAVAEKVYMQLYGKNGEYE